MTLEPTAGAFDGREHRLPVRIYYEDTDFSGLVYHANYLRFFERGRSDSLRLAGISHQALLDRAEPLALTVTRMNLHFRRAARVDDALVVHTLFEAVKGPRLFLAQRLTRAGETIAEAEVEVACITLDGRPRRPPPELATSLAALLPKGLPTGPPP